MRQLLLVAAILGSLVGCSGEPSETVRPDNPTETANQVKEIQAKQGYEPGMGRNRDR